MNRIRYRHVDESKLESMQTFKHPTNGAQYKVVLDKAGNSWSVLDAATDLVAASGQSTKLNYLKLEARKALSTLGVHLEKEARTRAEKHVA